MGCGDIYNSLFPMKEKLTILVQSTYHNVVSMKHAKIKFTLIIVGVHI